MNNFRHAQVLAVRGVDLFARHVCRVARAEHLQNLVQENLVKAVPLFTAPRSLKLMSFVGFRSLQNATPPTGRGG